MIVKCLNVYLKVGCRGKWNHEDKTQLFSKNCLITLKLDQMQGDTHSLVPEQNFHIPNIIIRNTIHAII